MIRGTKPTILYKLPFSTSIIKSAEITIKYDDGLKKILIKKTLDDCVLGEKRIETRLTQEETLQLPAPATIFVQLRILTTDDIALATKIHKSSVEKLLVDEVIQ